MPVTNRSPLPFLVLALLFGAARTNAQDDERSRFLGIRGGYELGIQSSQFPVYDDPACGQFSNGSASAAAAGLIYLTPTFFSDAFGATLTLDLSRMGGLFTATPLERLYLPGGTTDHEYRFHSSWETARLGAGLYGRISRYFGWGAGLELGARFNAKFSQSDTITGATDLRFLNGRSQEPMTPMEQLTAAPLTLGATLSGYARLPLSRRVSVLPTISLRADFLSAVRERNWQTYSAMGSVAILYDLAPPPAAPPVAPPAIVAIDTQAANPVVTPPPSRPHLYGAIDLYGVDEENHRLPAVTIRVYEVVYRNRSGMLGTFYFDRRSAALPPRYIRLGREERESFSIDSLASLGPVEIHHQSLNLLGLRLRENPSATLTLAGLTSKDEPKKLAAQRAAAVRSYLAATWGIDTARVGIAPGDGALPRASESTADGRAENRRVDIVAGSPRIMSPVVLERTRREFDPPLIAIDPTMRADAGVRRWDILLIRDGDTLGHYSSADTTDPASNIDWQVSTDRSGVLQTLLIAQLRVEDSLGTTTTANAQVPLVIEHNVRVVERSETLEGNRERITYSLLPFAYRSAELNARNEAVLDEVAAATRNGARITITGYTDRTGSEEGNADLSRRRADRVAVRLIALLRNRGVRGAEVITNGAGIDTERFSNDLPEGRALSRDVDIVIEQTLPKGIAKNS